MYHHDVNISWRFNSWSSADFWQPKKEIEFSCIFVMENVHNSQNIWLKFVFYALSYDEISIGSRKGMPLNWYQAISCCLEETVDVYELKLINQSFKQWGGLWYLLIYE